MTWQNNRLAESQAAELKEALETNHSAECSIDDLGGVELAHEATAMPREPYSPPAFGDGSMLIAVNTETVASLDLSVLEAYVGALLGRVAEVPVAQYKMGAAIAGRMKIGIPRKLLAEVLGLKDVDDDLSRSIKALLCGVLATTIAPLDIASLLFGFGNALHAHPAFAFAVKDATWEHPYGEHTTYRMAQVLAPGDGDETPITDNEEGE
jgi:hypothetical protein